MAVQSSSFPSITVAGVSAIVLDLAILAVGGLVLLALVFVPYGGAYIAIVGLPIYVIVAAASIFQLIAAINTIRRRAWARMAFLVCACGTAFSSILIILLVWIAGGQLSRSASSTQNAAESLLKLDLAVFSVFSIPIALSVWWFILFTRPRIVTAFQTASSLQDSPAPLNASTNPSFATAKARSMSSPVLGNIVAALLLVSGAFSLLSLLRHSPDSLPAFFFGAVLKPDTGWLVQNVLSLSLAGLALGLLRRKSFAIDVILVLLALKALNDLAAIASPNFVHTLQYVVASASQTQNAARPWVPSPTIWRGFMFLRLIYFLVLLVTLAASRNRFLRAVEHSRHLSS